MSIIVITTIKTSLFEFCCQIDLNERQCDISWLLPHRVPHALERPVVSCTPALIFSLP
jgi:hypothetical protein